jgi:CRP/FNR family transcriptional regulator, cyclic AMP receptor protein
MYTTVEKVLILKTVSIFKDVPDESLVDIAAAVKEQQFATGERFIEQDELGDALYIIVSGRVRVIRDDRVLAELGEREVVGELSALDPAPRSASVECLEETQLFTLNNLELEHQMAANSSIMRSILKILCARLRNAAASRGRRRAWSCRAKPKARLKVTACLRTW